MDIKVEVEEQPCLEVGDIVFAKDTFAIVRQENVADYIARCINNGYGLTGLHGTLKELQESLGIGAKIYPKSRYELVLREKR